MFDLLVGDLVRLSGYRAGQQRLRTLKDLDAAALVLREAWLTLRTAHTDPARDLEDLLEQETSLQPVQIAADTAGASEMGFGAFRMLGLQLAPLLADAAAPPCTASTPPPTTAPCRA